MAAKKSEDKTEEVGQDDAVEVAVVSVPAPNSSARPNDNPIGKYAYPNSSFADRAKASAARNKRVEVSESK